MARRTNKNLNPENITVNAPETQPAVIKKTNAHANAHANASVPETQPAAPETQAKKQTIENRRDAIKAQIKVTETVIFENDKTAKNGVNSAMVLMPSAIVLTCVSKDSAAAARLCEVYLHRDKADILFSKRVFQRLTTAVEGDAPETTKARKRLDSVWQSTEEKAREYKSKVRLFFRDGDAALVDLLNALVTIA